MKGSFEIETNEKNCYDAIVVGAGHAGCEAALALARLNNKTLCMCMSLESIAYMACNPSIGGTAKSHLVFEVDALGGEMGVNIDKTMLQVKTLNGSKGAAVQSLRAQADKLFYHLSMKKVLENTDNLDIVQAEAAKLIIKSGEIRGIETTLSQKYFCKALIIACGVYLNSQVVMGDKCFSSGPLGYAASTALSASLIESGFKIRRFKTGTPPRIAKKTIDFERFSVQRGEETGYLFSTKTPAARYKEVIKKQRAYPCYLGYTNLGTHEIIKENIGKSGMYSGFIKGVGPRYCPSIEDKIVRFSDKERHQIFLEPEGALTDEYYVQGLSTSMPPEVQEQILTSIEGLENAQIMRNAYAIEYDCVDSLQVLPTLAYKEIKGIYLAGQVIGSSGYEEAAAQGLIAGINASNYLQKKPPLIVGRDEGYIGVLIDDLVNKGVDEPYRMMTSRAEYRLNLRQDNADLRLTDKGISVGLVDETQKKAFIKKKKDIKKAQGILSFYLKGGDALNRVLGLDKQAEHEGLTVYDALKRPETSIFSLMNEFDGLKAALKGVSDIALVYVESEVKYSGYLKKQEMRISDYKRLENRPIPESFDYDNVKHLSIEARQCLKKIRPLTVGQAGRITGVSPADITVLLLSLNKFN